MNFQQMQHNEESDYEYDDERSLQTDDLSYLSSSYDTENEDGHDDDMSVKIGGSIMVDGEGLDEEEGEMELEGGKTKKTFDPTKEPYDSLHKRHGFREIMSYALSDTKFKSAFVDYINTGTPELGIINEQDPSIKAATLNHILLKSINYSWTSSITKNNIYFKSENSLQTLVEIMYDVPNLPNHQKPSLDSVINKLNDKVYLSNKFAIELMFCLTHFINDGCLDIEDTNVPSHQKFKRRYEYRELFVSFVKAYSQGKKKDFIKTALVTHKQNSGDSDQQKIFMKYLLLLIAFESDKLVTQRFKTPFVKLFSIPDPLNATEFINMLKRIMNCFSIGEDITPARIIIDQFNESSNQLLGNLLNSNISQPTINQWLEENLYSTIEFYLNLSYTKKRDDNNIDFTNGTLDYFKQLKQKIYKKSKLIQYLSDYVDENNDELTIKDNDLFFLEYITGNKQVSDSTGIYFYNHSLPIIPYASAYMTPSGESSAHTTKELMEFNAVQNN